jgi:hypothetical protein
LTTLLMGKQTIVTENPYINRDIFLEVICSTEITSEANFVHYLSVNIQIPSFLSL